MMSQTIYVLTIKRAGGLPEVTYYTTRQEAQESQRIDHEAYILNHLRTANRIKGALRGKGQSKMYALAAGIVADNIQYRIHTAVLQGDAQ